MEPDHHIKSRREGLSYPHRSHYTLEFDERNYQDSYERMRPEPCENRDNWRYHPPSSHGGLRYLFFFFFLIILMHANRHI
jgi:hypothetical protein